MALTVYGIPTCGTVKKARAWLDQHDFTHTFVDLRQQTPTRATVASWVAAFGAKALRNTSGGAYRSLGPEKDTWSDEAWVDAFTADPMLIKRPVITRANPPHADRPLLVGFRDPTAAKEALT